MKTRLHFCPEDFCEYGELAVWITAEVNCVIKEAMEREGIPLNEPDSIPSSIHNLRDDINHNPDLYVSASTSKEMGILNEKAMNTPTK